MRDVVEIYGTFDQRFLGKAMVIGNHADFCMPEMRRVARNLETGVCKRYLLSPNSLILSPILLFALKTL